MDTYSGVTATTSHSHHKIFPAYVQFNYPSFSLKPLLLVLLLQGLVKKFLSTFLLRLFCMLEGHNKVSSPGWISPAISASLHRRCVPSFWPFLWPFSGSAPGCLCLACIVESRVGCSTLGEVSWEWGAVERKNHLRWSTGHNYFDAAQVDTAFLRWKFTFPAHIEDFLFGLAVFMKLILTHLYRLATLPWRLAFLPYFYNSRQALLSLFLM